MLSIISKILLGLFVISIASAEEPKPFLLHKKLIGTPSSTLPPHFIRGADGFPADLVAVPTDSNVFAIINATSGALVWRRQLHVGERLLKYASHHDSVVTLSTTSDRLITRKLDLANGNLLWEHRGTVDETTTTDLWVEHGRNALVLTAAQSLGIQAISGNLGLARWTSSWGDPQIHLQRIVESDDTSITLLFSKERSSMHEFGVIKHERETGAKFSETLMAKASVANPSNILLVRASSESARVPSLVWVDSAHGNQLYWSRISNGKVIGPSSAFKGMEISSLCDVGAAEAGVFIAKTTSGAAKIVRLDADDGLVLAWDLEDIEPHHLYHGHVDAHGRPFITRLSRVLGLTSLEVINPTTEDLTAMTFSYDRAEFGDITQAFVEVTPINAYNKRTKVLITSSTGAVQLWEDGHLKWNREEGPTTWDPSLVALGHLSPPASSAHSSETASPFESNLIKDVLERVKGSKDYESRVKELLDGHEGRRRIAVGATPSGKVMAMDMSNKGQVIWRKSVTSETFGDDAELDRLEKLSWEVVGEEPIISVMTRFHTPQGTARAVIHLNPSDGKVIGSPVSSNLQLSENGELSYLSCSNRGEESHCIDISNSTLKHVPVGASPVWSSLTEGGWKLKDHAWVPQSTVASIGRGIDLESGLKKYLNPFLLGAVFQNEDKALSFVLIDGTSGSIITKTEHASATEPEVAVIDNWLVYSFTANQALGQATQLVSNEILQPLQGITAGKSSTVQQRSFYLNEPITAIGMTRTRLGITTKNLLLATTRGQILNIPRRLVDPRRPFGKASQQEQEEWLISYDPIIPSNPAWVVSGPEPVLGIEKIISVPSRLESSTFVFAFGLDVFFDAVAPSRAFDMLASNFNKIQLILTVAGLTAGIMVSRPIVRRRQLHQKWYP